MLEVCVDSIESAIAAYKGGAKRLELCSALSEGGLTPTAGLIKVVKTLIPDMECFILLRPRGGNFIYSSNEMDCIIEDMNIFQKLDVNGYVFGALNHQKAIDSDACKRIKNNSNQLPLTFHRAFDLTLPEEFVKNYHTIEQLGYTRILTSGMEANSKAGIPRIRQLIEIPHGNLTIMAGGGIKPDNAYEILTKTKCKEFHASARKVIIDNKNENTGTGISNNDTIQYQ